MIKRIALAVTLAIVAFLAYVAILPAKFSVDRSTTIAASPEAVFEHVNTLKKWPAWSPWAKRDPNMKMTYSGPEAGEGAVSAWAGDENVGEGKLTITESKPAERIKIQLDFIKPFEGSSVSNFVFEPAGSGTKVTWSLDGDQSFGERAFMLLLGMNMESMIGADYEEGLGNLKRVVEQG